MAVSSWQCWNDLQTEKKAFYEWHVGNGEGYEAEADPAAWIDASGQQPVLRAVHQIHMTGQQ